MPYSSLIFDKIINNLLRSIKPKTFLDVGAGAGKYGQMMKNINFKTRVCGIELEKDYIKKFDLNSIYTEVWCMSVMDLLSPKYYDLNFDVVMIGDIIEHLKKSDGIDLLNFLVYRTKWVIVQFPYKYLQNSVDGYTAEAHISVWNANDFKSFDATQVYKKDTQRLVMIRGYLEDELTLNQVSALMNKYEKK